MKTLYIDCDMGVSGEMLAGALLDLMPNKSAFLENLNAFQIPGVVFSADHNKNYGVVGTQFLVDTSGTQKKDTLYDNCEHMRHDWKSVLTRLAIPEKVKRDAQSVLTLVSEAESCVYGRTSTEPNFREVDFLSAFAEVITVCLLLHQLAPEQIFASSVAVGQGTLDSPRGVLPVPTPATAHILRNVPVCGGQNAGERCTLIGAALLKHFIMSFVPLPTMKISQIGYGIGAADGASPKFTRVMLGEMDSSGDDVLELSCNVDDMTGEQVGFALEQFLRSGALDAHTEAISMKKSRPAVKICVICREREKQTMISQMFRHTTTLGIREMRYKRYTLHREIRQIETPYGVVRRKDSSGYGVSRSKYEYEDLARIAREKNLSIDDVLTAIRQL